MDFPTASPGIQRQSLLDLVQRARGGVAIHLILWLLLGATGGIVGSAPVFFWGVAGGFGSIAACRLGFEPRIDELSLCRPRLARTLFLALLLINPAAWGVLGALTVVWPPLTSMSTPVWLVAIGVAASGGMALAFDPAVRSFYAPLAILPSVVAIVCNAAGADMFQPLAAVIFLAYIHRASKVVHGDYWSAVGSRVELEHRATLLEHMSATDTLTQLSNRFHFDRQVITEWARARRGSPAIARVSLMSVVMIDIDHFKRVNDSHGHPFGDVCLQAVAAALRSSLTRPADLLARFGGEEFVALLPGTDAEGAAVVSARMRLAVAAIAVAHRGATVKLTCSIGVHTVDMRVHGDPAAAVSKADQALYRAKRSGRNRVVVFDTAMVS